MDYLTQANIFTAGALVTLDNTVLLLVSSVVWIAFHIFVLVRK